MQRAFTLSSSVATSAWWNDASFSSGIWGAGGHHCVQLGCALADRSLHPIKQSPQHQPRAGVCAAPGTSKQVIGAMGTGSSGTISPGAGPLRVAPLRMFPCD